MQPPPRLVDKFGLFTAPLSKGGLGGDSPLAVQNIALFCLKNGRLKINFSPCYKQPKSGSLTLGQSMKNGYMCLLASRPIFFNRFQRTGHCTPFGQAHTRSN
jgi:hypothetical protein